MAEFHPRCWYGFGNETRCKTRTGNAHILTHRFSRIPSTKLDVVIHSEVQGLNALIQQVCIPVGCVPPAVVDVGVGDAPLEGERGVCPEGYERMPRLGGMPAHGIVGRLDPPTP